MITANIFSRADLVQYEKLSKSNAMFNLNHAFNLAEKEFGLVKLLDAGQLKQLPLLLVDTEMEFLDTSLQKTFAPQHCLTSMSLSSSVLPSFTAELI
jgi:hypothetical protein